MPVTVIKADELKKQASPRSSRSSAASAACRSSTTTAQVVGASTGGGSFADIRGLGANKTLVLLNGRRIANNAFNGVARLT